MAEFKKVKTSAQNTRDTYSVKEAAQRLGVSRLLLYQAIQRREIACVRIGRRILISRLVLDDRLRGTAA
jgi:excisionase family DNA binding protein